MNNNNSTFGVITEQNDLGLGFDPMNPKEQKTYQESVNRNQNKNSEKKETRKN